MHSEKEILERLDRLEQPYRAISHAIAQGILLALKESGMSFPPFQAVTSAEPQQTEQSGANNKAVADAFRETLPDMPGVCAIIGALPPGAVINEQALANIFGKCRASIKAAVDRGELPPPIRLMGKPTWTAGAIVKHFEMRLGAAEKEAERLRRVGRPRP